MTPDVLIWLAVGSLALATVSACGTRGLYNFSRHELEIYCRGRQNRALYNTIVDECDQVALGVEILSKFTQVLFVVACLFWLLLSGRLGLHTAQSFLAVEVLTGTLVLLVTTVWIPVAIVRLGAAPFLYHTWRLWKLSSVLLLPIAACGVLVDLILHRLAGKTRDRPAEEEFEDEIRAIVTEGLRDGLLEEDAREMIERVIELGDADVANILTPRSEVDAMDVSLTWHEMLNVVTTTRRTRIPVYDKQLDSILGILYVKDLLPELAKNPDEPRKSVQELLREPWSVPRTMPLDDLLQEFLHSRNHLAIVVDEHSSVAGIVTIEDVLEEIVGEIVDEHDTDEVDEQMIQVNNGSVELIARIHIDKVNEQLGLALPEDDEYETIGGFISMQLGHIPQVGEQVVWPTATITVLEASHHRVKRVRVDLSKDTRRESA